MKLVTQSILLFLLCSLHLPAFSSSSGVRMAAHLLAPLILFSGRINALGEENESQQLNSAVQQFQNELGKVEIKWMTCNDPYFDSDEDFDEVHEEHSLYQKIIFKENPTDDDKCLRLDDTLQQCSTYRPHYHEPFVHYSASYLNDGIMSGVKRVVFVGGGDSMLLHEVLKYQGLEMVLGLELDQKVTR
jgi:hypothetical protein